MKKISMNNNNNTTTSATKGFPVIIAEDMAIVAVDHPHDIGRHISCDEGTLVFLSVNDTERIRSLINNSHDYKLTTQVVSVILEMANVNSHIRHKIERRLIANLGNHKHTCGIRRHFICG